MPAQHMGFHLRNRIDCHADLDGFRMRRGGSWRSVPEGVGAVSGATSLPLDGSSLVGFRGVLSVSHE